MPPCDPAFSPDAMKRVETIEALPFSHAFERIMYDRSSTRQAEHTMDQPIVLTPYLQETILPEEIRNSLPSSSHCTIDDLYVRHIDLKDAGSQLDITFTADRRKHHLQSSEDSAQHIVESYSGEDAVYATRPDTVLSLLAAFVYARQYDERDQSASMEYTQSQLELPRSDTANLSEQLIITLGHLDGTSTITTNSLFITDDHEALLAKMTEGESPTTSSLQSKLELAHLTSRETTDRTDLHQHIVNTSADYLPQPITLENRFAEHHIADELVFVDPERDYPEWSRICDSFLTIIEADLANYSHLDEDPYS